MEPSFERLLAILASGEVRFVVVGGVAVTIQGYVRLTEDIDLLVDAEPANIRRLLDVLGNFGEGFARELSPDDFLPEEGAIRIVEATEQTQIDLFTQMSGRGYGDVIGDADFFTVSGHRIAIASKAALIGWKENSARDKDRIDANALRQLEENPRAFD